MTTRVTTPRVDRSLIGRLRSVVIVVLSAVFVVGLVGLSLVEAGFDRLWPLSFVGFVLVGAVILTRRSRNRVGWVLFGLGSPVGIVSVAAVVKSFVTVSSSISLWVGWITLWSIGPSFGLIPYFLLWYPTGQPPSKRWRALSRVMAGFMLILIGYYAVRPGPLIDYPADNPLGLSFLAPLRDSTYEEAAGGLVIAFGGAALVSMINRWRKAVLVERQQLKWLASATLLFVILFVAGATNEEGAFGEIAMGAAFVVGFNGMAGAVGVAILRYRLYEIDRIISRTVAYGVVAAVLALVYAVGVVGVPRLLPIGEESDVAVAASTLAAAALFSPLRRRVQRWMDRRFNRSRYNAARTVEEFGARLRDAVDLDSLTTDLATVVGATLEPAGIRLILKEPSR